MFDFLKKIFKKIHEKHVQKYLKVFFSTISLNLFFIEVLLKFLNKSMKNMFKCFLKFLKHS